MSDYTQPTGDTLDMEVSDFEYTQPTGDTLDIELVKAVYDLVVDTLDATNLDSTEATLNGDLIDMGPDDTYVYFKYRKV